MINVDIHLWFITFNHWLNELYIFKCKQTYPKYINFNKNLVLENSAECYLQQKSNTYMQIHKYAHIMIKFFIRIFKSSI